MLPVKYFVPTKPLFVLAEFHGDHVAKMLASGYSDRSFYSDCISMLCP